LAQQVEERELVFLRRLLQPVHDGLEVTSGNQLHAEAWIAQGYTEFKNINTKQADGYYGWAEQAPFDKIIVTAAGEEVPEALLKQLRVGGVMVIPVGPLDGVQKLMRIERTETGTTEKSLSDVRFVPLIPGKAQAL